MAMPLVSIIIPTYNGEKFIAQTLASIIYQDYENIEIIVVDDVSTDNTVEVAQKILEKSGRKFQLIRRTVNGHQSAARNTGLKSANGDYVIFFDHDDLAEKNFVSSLCNEAENKKADLVFCGVKTFFKDENRYEFTPPPPEVSPQKFCGNPEKYLLAKAKGEIDFRAVWQFIYRKKFILKNNFKFPEDCFILEDTEFILKTVAKSSRIYHINDALYCHVMHAAQQTRADVTNRNNYKNTWQEVMTLWRGGRCVLKNTSNKALRKYVTTYCFADKLLKVCTRAAQAGDREYYDMNIRHFKHKKIRKIALSTIHFIFSEPELFFKALMILYAPNLYYKLRRK